MSITMIGMDTAKSVFQVHGVDVAGKTRIRRKLSRSGVVRHPQRQCL
jgi:transposase